MIHKCHRNVVHCDNKISYVQKSDSGRVYLSCLNHIAYSDRAWRVDDPQISAYINRLFKEYETQCIIEEVHLS